MDKIGSYVTIAGIAGDHDIDDIEICDGHYEIKEKDSLMKNIDQ